MDDALLSIVIARVEDADLDTETALQVLAACEGKLDEYLGDTGYERPSADRVADVDGPALYLQDLAVQGFRGIGERQTLPLESAPGLTVVIGRNGSGKSSFAEAAEVLLTGANQRWQNRPVHWQEGWRNLHSADVCEISAELSIDGEAGPVKLQRRWTTDNGLDDARTIVQAPDQPERPLEALGWDHAMVTYRPFLSYNELSSMLEGRPSELHDAMSSILGLDEVDIAVKSLGDAKRLRMRQVRDVRTELEPLLAQLSASDDERAVRCHEALSGHDWDLDLVDEILLADEVDAEAGGTLTTLRGLAALSCPSVEETGKLIAELREAHEAAERVAGTSADRAEALARVLSVAIEVHENHGDQDCPVCGLGRLDAGWRETAADEATRLDQEAAEARRVHHRREGVMAAARRLAADFPAALERGDQVDVATLDAATAWRQFQALPDGADLMAAHLERTHPSLLDAVALVRSEATVELNSRNAAWLPVARALSRWSSDARHAVGAARQAEGLAASEQWLKEAAAELRTERFQPIARQARELWEQLRQESSVQLDAVVLAGAATRRRLELSVSVDGSDGSALGVMSQGELHALALSLFLPRATLPDSPFRFLVIDDPVQAMDAVRVDGLARVFERYSRDRQIVVFSHDGRLVESLRRLSVQATILRVARQPHSIVKVTSVRDAISTYIDDAHAITRDRGVEDSLINRVVPGLCRGAIEAACVEVVRRRWADSGMPRARIDRVVEEARRTRTLLALALFDDPSREADVSRHLHGMKPRFAQVVAWCIRGAHDPGDIQSRKAVKSAIDSASGLAKMIRSVRA